MRTRRTTAFGRSVEVHSSPSVMEVPSVTEQPRVLLLDWARKGGWCG